MPADFAIFSLQKTHNFKQKTKTRSFASNFDNQTLHGDTLYNYNHPKIILTAPMSI